MTTLAVCSVCHQEKRAGAFRKLYGRRLSICKDCYNSGHRLDCQYHYPVFVVLSAPPDSFCPGAEFTKIDLEAGGPLGVFDGVVFRHGTKIVRVIGGHMCAAGSAT